MSTRDWNVRLAAWQTHGHGSAVTRLLDRVVAGGISAPASVVEPDRVMGPIHAVTVEIECRGERHRIDARAVRAVVADVRWLQTPRGDTIGLVGNAPRPALWAPAGGRALVLVRDGREMLAPFERLQIRRSA